MNELFSLKGCVALITGGDRGIGRAIAGALASAGADIVVAARNQPKIDEAVRSLRQEYGVRALGVSLDVKQEAQAQSAVASTLETFGQIDILVNNAGVSVRKLPQEVTAEEWDEVQNTNLRGTFLCSKAAYPAMQSAKRGKIINLGAMAALFGASRFAPYSASKGGIIQLTRSLAVAWAQDNIQVNAILPGFINTDMARAGRKLIPGLEESVTTRTPAGRWGEPEDIAGAAIFLASHASDFITGVSLPVDGGYSVMLV